VAILVIDKIHAVDSNELESATGKILKGFCVERFWVDQNAPVS